MKIKEGDKFLMPSILKGETFTITVIKVHKFRRVVKCLHDEITLPGFYLSFKQLAKMRKL